MTEEDLYKILACGGFIGVVQKFEYK